MDRQIITVDIAPGSNAQQRLMVSQGDIGRPLGVKIIQNGLPLNCTGYTAHLYVLKPDHNYYECTCTISNNNLISWDTAEQETPVAGECLAEIRITSGTNDIGTATFIEFVEASPADLGYASESLISSMTEYVDAAQQAAEEATEIVEDYDNVNDVAVDSSGHIVLTKVHGSTVTSDETVVQLSDLNKKLSRSVQKTTGAFNSKYVPNYLNIVLETIRTNVNNYSSGAVLDLPSTGPHFGAWFYKFTNDYWSALVFSYADLTPYVAFAQYQDGTCKVLYMNFDE